MEGGAKDEKFQLAGLEAFSFFKMRTFSNDLGGPKVRKKVCQAAIVITYVTKIRFLCLYQ